MPRRIEAAEDIPLIKELVIRICKSCEPYKRVIARVLGGKIIRMVYTDIGFNFDIEFKPDGTMIPSWGHAAKEDVDIHLFATLYVWNLIFSGQLDPTRAFLSGRLRCKGSMRTIVKTGELAQIFLEVIEREAKNCDIELP